MRTKEDTLAIVDALKQEYPIAECSLDYGKAWQLMVAVRLAAQCTDARVNLVTPVLFAKYPTLTALAAANVVDIELIIKSCGFFHSKAKDIHASANMLLSEYNGLLPQTMDDMLRLPGVGRKSANLLLGDVYNTPGVVVADTHLIRISNRLGFIDSKDPLKVEMALREVLPEDESNNFCHRCVLHGRAVCTARKTYCDKCVLMDLCPTAAQA